MNKIKKKLIYIYTIILSFVLISPVIAGEFPDPMNGADLSIIIGRVINVLLGVVGSLFLVIFIYGGVTWMMSSGNSEKVQKGKSTLMWATIGLVAIFASYALVKFILDGLRHEKFIL